MIRLTRSLLLVAGVSIAACSADRAVAPTCAVSFPAGSTLGLVVGASLVVPVAAACNGVATADVQFASSAPDVVQVDASSGRISALKPGGAIITVTARGGVAVGVASVTVSAVCPLALVTSISVTPNAATLVPNAQVKIGVRTVRSACGTPDVVDSGATFVSLDTTVATVTPDGVVTARGPVGATTLIVVTSKLNTNLQAMVPTSIASSGVPVVGLTVSPRTLTLGMLDTARIAASVALNPNLPAGTSRAVTFRSADTCAVRVDSTGLVLALSFTGVPTNVVVASAEFPSVAQLVSVTVGPPHSFPSPLVSTITVGGSNAPADIAALRGAVDVKVLVERLSLPGTGRVEAWLAGRLAATAPLARFTPGAAASAVTLTIDTNARDAQGNRLYANGPASLEFRVYSDGTPAPPSCYTAPAGYLGTRSVSGVTLANP